MQAKRQIKLPSKWWNPAQFSQKKANLTMRAQIMRAMRSFFDGQGFVEVETPILQVCPVIDTHIRAFATDLRGVDGQVKAKRYLHTSPEFDMKKLLVAGQGAGMDKIFQICPVFRNAEGSKRHRCEFTLVEWYRTEADYIDMMRDCEGLLQACTKAVAKLAIKAHEKSDIEDGGAKILRYKAYHCDPFQPFERLSVVEAFARYTDIDLTACLDDKELLREQVIKLGLHVAEDDGWDDLFFRVMDDKIEPNLGMGAPTFLCDYPIAMASLSKPKDSDPRFAERFELYVCGIELANAFSELTDADEQVRRYHIEMDEKERLYGERYPLDEEFIEALRHGLPRSGGIALGVDRLVMLICGVDDIADVLWCG